ncbi:MAG: hypothetical protein AMK73_08825 [Planctomycetes bacterium SM23_32]|nr:MAG: hypothetical protein AMK73_08825 [Planctomycetes bacterium SM23_32]
MNAWNPHSEREGGVRTEPDIAATIDYIAATGMRLRRIARQREDPESLQTITELLMAVDGLKEQADDLLQQARRQPARGASNSSQSELASGLQLRRGAYYATNAREDQPSGPFCTACADNRERLIVLRPAPGLPGVWACPDCKKLTDVTGLE